MTRLTAFSINAALKLLEIIVKVLPFVEDAINLFKKKHDDQPQQPESCKKEDSPEV